MPGVGISLYTLDLVSYYLLNILNRTEQKLETFTFDTSKRSPAKVAKRNGLNK